MLRNRSFLSILSSSSLFLPSIILPCSFSSDKKIPCYLFGYNFGSKHSLKEFGLRLFAETPKCNSGAFIEPLSQWNSKMLRNNSNNN